MCVTGFVCVRLGARTVIAGLPLQRPGRIRAVRYLCMRRGVVWLLGTEVSPVSPVLRQHVAGHLQEKRMRRQLVLRNDVDSFLYTAAPVQKNNRVLSFSLWLMRKCFYDITVLKRL